jgi:hypothetical protein
MTAEEFFRNKIKEKNPLIEIITLSSILVTAEEAMRWSYEFNQLVKSEIPIIPDPSDAVTRLEVIDKQGRVYSQWNCSIQLSYQDNGKTLKIFVNN